MPRAARTDRQRTRQLDAALAAIVIPARPSRGWIAAIRQALGMTATQLARRMGVARQSLTQLEENEASGVASLASLARAADALGCDVEWVLVPRRPLAETVGAQARRRAAIKLGRINRSQSLEASAVGADSFDSTVEDLAREYEVTRPADLWDD